MKCHGTLLKQAFRPKRTYTGSPLTAPGTQDYSNIHFKVIPQHTYEGAGEERRYSSYSFTDSALDGGRVVSVTPRPRF